MKIVMITSYPPDKCGISDYSYNLVREMRKRANVLVISRKGDSEKDLIHRKKVKRSWLQIVEELMTLPQSYKDVNECMRIIEKEKPNVVHAQYEPGLYNLFFLPKLFERLKNYPKIKKILTLHAIDYFPLNVFHSVFLYGKPDKIIVHTEYHKKLVGKKNKVVKVPMGMVPKTINAKQKDYAMFFGFLSAHKGVENLIEAFDSIKDKTNTNLLISGSINPAYKHQIDYKQRLEHMISELGLSDRIQFVHSYVPAQKLYKLIAESKFVVFPYLKSYSGGQSQAIMDAISLGKPVIISNLPGLVENIINGKNGLIVEPGDEQELGSAFLKLSNSKKLLKTISGNNKKLARELSWKNVARKTLGAY
jgi:glycosyltransferase involved in cell wall biosynthesis